MKKTRTRVVVGSAVALWLGFVCAGVQADVQVRVATFNIENFDPSNPTQFDAAVAILNRVEPDVVCVQEINDISDLNALAAAGAADYSYKVLADGSNSFDGANHAGILSVYPFNTWSTATSQSLSGDPSARDITRNFIVAEIIVPGAAEDLVIIGNHWKSGTQDADEFRRSIESIRAMQVTADYDSSVIPYLVVGDMNDDILDSPDSPSQFWSVPGGMPVGYSLGSDITYPVQNGVFKALQAGTGSQDLTVINARQKDNSDATRPASGRRLDYLWHSTAVTVVGSEVYDSEDEVFPGGLTKYGDPLASGTSNNASDHLLVFADIDIPDDQSGACCTACGCESVNEAECQGLGGTFLGAGVSCEPDPCPAPSNGMIINEVLKAHDGTQDQEFVELYGEPHQLLCGLTLLVVEGQTLSKGLVDRAISLDDCGGGYCSFDENGYFTIGGSGLVPPADWVVGGTNYFEDGSETFALVRDCLVSTGMDIDTDNDGVIDVPVGTVVDAIGFVDGDYPVSDFVYFDAPAFGPDGTSVPAGAARCPNGVDTNTLEDWVQLSWAMDGSDGCVPVSPGASNPATCGGDYDGDGDYDLEDFAAFQQCFGTASAACSAFELTPPCGINIDDFDIFITRLQGPE